VGKNIPLVKGNLRQKWGLPPTLPPIFYCWKIKFEVNFKGFELEMNFEFKPLRIFSS